MSCKRALRGVTRSLRELTLHVLLIVKKGHIIVEIYIDEKLSYGPGRKLYIRLIC